MSLFGCGVLFERSGVRDDVLCLVQILRTFFALIFGTILFSLLAGLVWLPVALSIIGPAYIRSAAGPAAMDLPSQPAACS